MHIFHHGPEFSTVKPTGDGQKLVQHAVTKYTDRAASPEDWHGNKPARPAPRLIQAGN